VADDSRLGEAERLAETLHLPLSPGAQSQGFLYALVLTAARLELSALAEKTQGPIYSNLWDAEIRRRIQGGRRQPLARACGLHREGALRILDATAGLGRDAVVLAGLGCQVTLLERVPVTAALLQDGLTRACLEPDCGDWVRERVVFLQQDAREFMQAVQQKSHDVVYLDPMYPVTNKSALAKKEMRVLRAIAGDDLDADQLLQAALEYAAQRVVVKRAPNAGYLAGLVPDHQAKGNRARYDVYFTRKAQGNAAI
jgi:16S rRNA (guanine1516-N2)-methyltransferase